MPFSTILRHFLSFSEHRNNICLSGTVPDDLWHMACMQNICPKLFTHHLIPYILSLCFVKKNRYSPICINSCSKHSYMVLFSVDELFWWKYQSCFLEVTIAKWNMFWLPFTIVDRIHLLEVKTNKTNEGKWNSCCLEVITP